MPVVKLTPGFVRDAKCEPGVTRTVYWDRKFSRFGLQVTNKGAKSYVFQYRDKATRKQTRITYRFDSGLNKARKLAEDDAAKVTLGTNPTSERRKEEGAAETTLKAICKEYFKREGGRLRSKGQMERALDRLVYPRLGDRQIEEIRRSELIRLLDTIEDENGPATADYTLAVIRQIMGWHASRSDDWRSPIIKGMARTKPGERARTRILSDDELRSIWKVAGKSKGPFGPFLKFVLLTACRRTEAASMTYGELVGTDWIIPASRYKTKRETVLPLSQAARDVLASLTRIDGVDYVFTTGSKPISGYSNFKYKFDEACRVTGWTIHDLRRSARSLMSRAGVPADHAERCLGHAIGGVRGVYDRYEYRDEKLRAFEALAAQIDRIIHPKDNVVPLRTEVPA